MYYLGGGNERVLHVTRGVFLLTYYIVEDDLEVLALLLFSLLHSRMGMYSPHTNRKIFPRKTNLRIQYTDRTYAQTTLGSRFDS